MPRHLAVRNPYVTTNALKSKLKNASQETIDKFTQSLIKQGYVLAGQRITQEFIAASGPSRASRQCV